VNYPLLFEESLELLFIFSAAVCTKDLDVLAELLFRLSLELFEWLERFLGCHSF